jgi:hypothetical protein
MEGSYTRYETINIMPKKKVMEGYSLSTSESFEICR